MRESPVQQVFVYGTLRRGGSNHHRMDGCKWLGPARVNGRLYKVDWYPALVLDAAAAEVAGDLFEATADCLARLDDYEGGEYRRVKARVTDNSGQGVEAWLWEWSDSTKGLQAVISGDWLAVNHE